MDVFTFELYVLRYTFHFSLKLHKTYHLKQIVFLSAVCAVLFHRHYVQRQTYNLKKRVMLFLETDGCFGTVAGINHAFIRQNK